MPTRGYGTKMSEKRDYYEVLGVDRGAGADEIKRAYRKLALECHPDRNKDNPSAEERFKEAAEAYDVLGNPEKRAQYDRFGHAAFSAGAGAGGPGFTNIQDIFDAFEWEAGDLSAAPDAAADADDYDDMEGEGEHIADDGTFSLPLSRKRGCVRIRLKQGTAVSSYAKKRMALTRRVVPTVIAQLEALRIGSVPPSIGGSSFGTTQYIASGSRLSP